MVSEQWLGIEFREMLNIHHIGVSRLPNFLAASNAAIQDYNDSRESHPVRTVPTITLETKTVLENLCFAMQMITSETIVHDYRAYVVETDEYKASVKVSEFHSNNLT